MVANLKAEQKSLIAVINDLVERPIKLVIPGHILHEQINKNPLNGAQTNKTAARSGVNHAELLNPD